MVGWASARCEDNMVVDSDSPKNCAICKRPPADGVEMQNSGVFDGLVIICPQCGRYELAGTAAIVASFQWKSELRNALSCAARQATEAGQPLRITSAEAGTKFAEPHMNTRVSDNQERLLREIAKRAGRPNGEASFLLPRDFTLIDCYSMGEFVWYIEWLKTQKLVFQTGVDPAVARLTPSMDGWNRVQPVSRAGSLFCGDVVL
jgi:hypothetical protein